MVPKNQKEVLTNCARKAAAMCTSHSSMALFIDVLGGSLLSWVLNHERNLVLSLRCFVISSASQVFQHTCDDTMCGLKSLCQICVRGDSFLLVKMLGYRKDVLYRVFVDQDDVLRQ